jgi:hypothetical protein
MGPSAPPARRVSRPGSGRHKPRSLRKLRDFILRSRPQPSPNLVVESDRNRQAEEAARTKPSSGRGAGKTSRRGSQRNGGTMGSMKKWMALAALAVGTLGLGTSQAKAARIGVGVYVGAPAVYVPPCPGPGYGWVAGYYANGYWVPGFWRAPAPRPGVVFRGGVAFRGGYGYVGHGPAYNGHFGGYRR